MVTGHDIMQFPYQKEILCASPKQPTYRRYWGRRRKEEGREEGSIVRGNKAGKMFEVHIKQKESKGDHGYHTTGERWRDMEGEDRYYHTVLEGKEMAIFAGHIIQGKIDFLKIYGFMAHTSQSSPSLYLRNVLHCPILWQEWRESTGSGSWSTDLPAARGSIKKNPA